VLATANLVGGFVVTDRMLEMFGPRKAGGRADTGAVRGRDAGVVRSGDAGGAGEGRR
jgi:NAD(P) transhydrogenase subunit alpha